MSTRLRKRKADQANIKLADQVGSDAEQKSDNDQPRKRGKGRSKKTVAQDESEQSESERQSQDDQETQKVVFDEDENQVEMEVHGNEFQSEASEVSDPELTEDEKDKDGEGNDDQGIEIKKTGKKVSRKPSLDRQSESDQLSSSSGAEESSDVDDSNDDSSPRRRHNKRRHSNNRKHCSRRSKSRSRNRSRSTSSPRRRGDRRSLEKQLEQMSSTLMVMQNFMIKKGMFDDERGSPSKASPQKKKSKKSSEYPPKTHTELISNSDTTIYNNILREVDDVNDTEQLIDPVTRYQDGFEMETVDSEVAFKIRKERPDRDANVTLPEERRESSSSDDKIDTSDELMEVDCDNLIAEGREKTTKEQDAKAKAGDTPSARCREFQSDKLIRESEENQQRPNVNPGNYNYLLSHVGGDNGNMTHSRSTDVDDNYLAIGGHIDHALQQRIIDFEYIDFSRLLPKDRISKAEDHRYELVVRGGSTFFAPVSDRDATTITNFSKWEQVFRIFSNILTMAYPGKVSELIQYNHIIYTASLSYIWDNVYHYDKEFRMHVSKYPQRSWYIILQQAWSMCLKDKLIEENRTPHSKAGKKFREPCRRFNRGKCTYGVKCHYDHRCAIKKCGKFGHGAHVCRLRDENQASTSSEAGTTN